MSSLLNEVLEAHGGLRRWHEVHEIEADAEIYGAMWIRKGQGDVLRGVHITAKPREQWISYSPFKGEGKRSVCTPQLTLIEGAAGNVVSARDNPRAAFEGHTVETKWDDLHLAYFSGYAMWNYLTVPFTFALPGFEFQEIEPWQENNETWRRLRVLFPGDIATHCSEQVFHINPKGLIVRMDYSAAATGGAPTAHYLLDHKNFDGIVLPSRRRALRRNPDGTVQTEPTYVAIDFGDIRFR
jgi:hypothetical protein